MRRIAILLAFAAGAAAAGDLRVGRASVKITPKLDVPGSDVTGVHDDLFAKAIVFDKDGARAAMIACDLAVIRRPVAEEARLAIEKETGLAGARVMISATHTHTGFIPGWLGTDRLEGAALRAAQEYQAWFAAQLAKAVQEAIADLRPARVSAAIGHEDSLSFNRRFLMKDGTARFNPGFKNPEIIRPLGPIDPAVPVVYFESADGTPLATLVNFALHLDTVGGKEISADYPYTLARLLAQAKGPAMLTLFTIGTAGNLNHFDVTRPGPQKGHGEAARIGTILAAEVLRTYRRLEPVADGEVRVSREMVQWPVPQFTTEEVEKAREISKREKLPFLDQIWTSAVLAAAARDGRPVEAEVQVIAVGEELAWVGLPAEIFVEIGMAIRNASPFRFTVINELANDWLRYVPNRKGYAEGAYEGTNIRGGRGSGEMLIDSATRQLVAMSHWSAAERLFVAESFTEPGSFTAEVEGPACDGEGNVYAVSFARKDTIGKVTPEGRGEVFLQMPAGSLGNGIRFDSKGMMFVADHTGHNILRVDPKSRAVDVFAHEPRMNQPNDVAIGSDETLWASDPDWKGGTGQLWRIGRDRAVTRVAADLGTTNGIEVSPDGKTLYVNETVQRSVWAFPIRGDGTLGERQLLIRFDDFGLDGMRCDVDGNLYVTRHGKGTVVKLSPRGDVLREIDVLGKMPTNLCFGGPDGRTVYVTEADTKRLVRFRVDRPGLEWNRWR